MNLLIINQSADEHGKHIELSDGKKSVSIYFSSINYINVCNLNASHKAWKGNGRYFWSFEDAVAAYKSAFMKSALAFAKDHLAA
jgi:hypothetical protein